MNKLSHIKGNDQDQYQRIGQALTRPLVFFCGHTYKFEGEQVRTIPSSCIARTALVALAIFTLPISALLMGIGCCLLRHSKTYQRDLTRLKIALNPNPNPNPNLDPNPNLNPPPALNPNNAQTIPPSIQINELSEEDFQRANEEIYAHLEICYDSLKDLDLNDNPTEDEFSLEELREDFQRYAEMAIENRDRTCNQEQLDKWKGDVRKHLNLMVEALPYHLQKKCLTTSPYPSTGIKNYGNTCYINAGLQVLTHTRFADYALLRPIKKPELQALEEPQAPIKPKLDDFTFGKNEIEELKAASREYDKAKESYESSFKRHERELERFRAYQYEQTYYPALLENYESTIGTQSLLRHLVFNLREGVAPTSQDISKLQGLMDLPRGYTGDANRILSAAMCTTKQHYSFRLKLQGMGNEALQGGILKQKPWSIIVRGNSYHYWVEVKKPDNSIHTINDNSVTQSHKSRIHSLGLERNRPQVEMVEYLE